MKRASPLLIVLVAVVLLALASGLRPSLLEQKRKELGALGDAPPPPDVAVPRVVLGAFRGLAVDYLWLRAMRLEDEGKYFESSELASWISKLEPRLDAVWAFQAHGLAYDRSASVDDPEQRWRWIQKGIELLRDEAIPLNPRSPDLYFHLSGIYSEKIGGPFDDNHLLFKKWLALELGAGFGAPGEQADFEALARSPESEAGLEEPARKLLSEMRALGFSPEKTRDDLEAALEPAPAARSLIEKARSQEGTRACASQLVTFFRARWLRGHRIDPARAFELEKTYGPLDWHGCDAQALYWAAMGARAARTLGGDRSKRLERKLERIAIAAVKTAMRRGRIIITEDGAVLTAPEPRLAQRVLSLYDAAISRAREAEAANESIPEEAVDDDGHEHAGAPHERDLTAAIYRQGLENARKSFYPEAILVLAQYGREAEARRVFARFAKEHRDIVTKPYEDFVGDLLRYQVLGEEAATQVTTTQLLEGTWTRAWTFLALGDDERAIGLISLADRVDSSWKKYIQKKKDEGDPEAPRRLGVDARKIQMQTLEDVKKRLSPKLRERLEERAPALLGRKPPEEHR